MWLSAFLPVNWQLQRNFRLSIRVYMMVVFLFMVTTNMTDVELFKFTGRRATPSWLSLGDDMQAQSWNLLSYYWWYTLVSFLMVGLCVRYWPEFSEKAKTKLLALAGRRYLTRTLVGICAAILIFTGLRGGYQFKPLNINHAYSQSSLYLGTLILNSTFHFLKSGRFVDSTELRFFSSDLEAETILKSYTDGPSLVTGQLKDWNVVILLVESLASEYMGAMNNGRGYTPFLDSLAQQGVLFKQNFANGRQSVEAIPSVVCGIPSFMNEPLIVSTYQGVDLHCLGELAKNAGYHSAFFHGAYNGSMHFDTFSNRAGFAKFYGFNEYPDKKDGDGAWGVLDEPFLQFAIDEFNRFDKPFVSVIFTLSSHHPYPVPEKYKGKFPKGTLEIHESIGYADYALQQFFARAKEQKWFDKTLFIITGDHTHKSDVVGYHDLIGHNRVPLLLYAPKAQMKIDTEQITQHIDILPTIRDLLGWGAEPRHPFGRNIFSSSTAVAYNHHVGGYWLLSQAGLVNYASAQEKFVFYRTLGLGQTEQLHESKAAELSKEQERLKALVHSFNQRVRHNSLYKNNF